jgi:hypothetical protein
VSVCPIGNQLERSLFRNAQHFLLAALFGINPGSVPPHGCTSFVMQWFAPE